MIKSKFLRKEDIDEELIVTIKTVQEEEMPGGGNEKKWCLYFKELPKGMVLNQTTTRVLEKSFGGEHTDAWAGKKVTLYVDPNVSFKGQVVGGLRLKPVKPPKPSTTIIAGDGPAGGNPAAASFEFDDEIPFGDKPS
jgi:hypothetical protein